MEILIRLNQIDKDYKVDINSNDERSTQPSSTPVMTMLDNENKVRPVMATSKQREMDTFMYNDYQFFRVGEVFGKIASDDTMITISSSWYYSNRKKASYGQK